MIQMFRNQIQFSPQLISKSKMIKVKIDEDPFGNPAITNNPLSLQLEKHQ